MKEEGLEGCNRRREEEAGAVMRPRSSDGGGGGRGGGGGFCGRGSGGGGCGGVVVSVKVGCGGGPAVMAVEGLGGRPWRWRWRGPQRAGSEGVEAKRGFGCLDVSDSRGTYHGTGSGVAIPTIFGLGEERGGERTTPQLTNAPQMQRRPHHAHDGESEVSGHKAPASNKPKAQGSRGRGRHKAQPLSK